MIILNPVLDEGVGILNAKKVIVFFFKLNFLEKGHELMFTNLVLDELDQLIPELIVVHIGYPEKMKRVINNLTKSAVIKIQLTVN